VGWWVGGLVSWGIGVARLRDGGLVIAKPREANYVGDGAAALACRWQLIFKFLN